MPEVLAACAFSFAIGFAAARLWYGDLIQKGKRYVKFYERHY